MTNYGILRGDYNRNGRIDNDREARANTEFNSFEIDTLQKELRSLKNKIKLNTIVSSNQSAAQWSRAGGYVPCRIPPTAVLLP